MHRRYGGGNIASCIIQRDIDITNSIAIPPSRTRGIPGDTCCLINMATLKIILAETPELVCRGCEVSRYRYLKRKASDTII